MRQRDKITLKISRARLVGIFAVFGFALIGSLIILFSRAATPTANIEPELGTLSGVQSVTDATASNGRAIKFSSQTGFVHPGIFVSKAQLDLVKGKIAANEEPWLAAYNKARSSRFASLTYTASPVTTIDCDNNAAGCTDQYEDAIAAYTQALLWYYSGNRTYAQNAIRILNAWATTVTGSSGNQAHLNNAWTAETLPRAAEIMRYTFTPTGGETALNVTAVSSMFKNVMLPQIAANTTWSNNSNGNWDLSMTEGAMNIGIFTDDQAIYDAAVQRWKARVPSYIYMTSDGSGPIAPPGGAYNTAAKVRCFWLAASSITESCTVPSGFAFQQGQSQETCRDLSHAVMGFEAMINAAETAKIQGDDLYGLEQARIIAGYELNARYTSAVVAGGSVPTALCGGTLSLGGTGYTLGWEVAYNEYVGRRGGSMPYTKALIPTLRPDSAALHMVYETLTHGTVIP
jgi:hypothetical protein